MCAAPSGDIIDDVSAGGVAVIGHQDLIPRVERIAPEDAVHTFSGVSNKDEVIRRRPDKRTELDTCALDQVINVSMEKLNGLPFNPAAEVRLMLEYDGRTRAE